MLKACLTDGLWVVFKYINTQDMILVTYQQPSEDQSFY